MGLGCYFSLGAFAVFLPLMADSHADTVAWSLRSLWAVILNSEFLNLQGSVFLEDSDT
jgi:hypothetical protein